MSDRAQQAYKLKLTGQTLDQVARELRYKTPAAVWKAIYRYIETLSEEEQLAARQHLKRKIKYAQKGKTGSKPRTGIDDAAPLAARSVTNYELWKAGRYRR